MEQPAQDDVIAQVQDTITRLVQERPGEAATALAVGLVASAAALYLAERDSDGPINTYGDALWNATTTVAALGESGCPPVTPAGRLVGALLLLAGCPLYDRTKAQVSRAYDSLTQPGTPPAHVCGSEDLRDKLDLVAERLGELCQLLSENHPAALAALEGPPAVR